MNLFRLTIVALMGAGSLYGEPPRRGGGGAPSGRPPEGGRDFKGFFESADSNSDGHVSLVEFAALERISKIPEEKRAEIFKRFDKNGDGQIQRSEMKPPERPDGDKRFFPRIHELDSNKDGKVTFEEFEKGEFAGRMPKDRLGEFFGKLDRNGDGELSPADMSQDRRPPYDRPRDGGPPNRDGRFQNHESGKMIEALDKDGDKALSFDEFRQAPWLKDKSEDEQEDLFEKIDKNGDLSIVKSELPVEGPKGPERKRPAGPNGPGPRAPKGPDGGQ